jgi:uncharacterized protein with GYD domain
MFGRYSPDAIREISSDRTDEAVKLIENAGGEIVSMYATLGMYDLVVIANFPNVAEAMKASVGLNMITGITFSTTPAVPAADFDRMISEI